MPVGKYKRKPRGKYDMAHIYKTMSMFDNPHYCECANNCKSITAQGKRFVHGHGTINRTKEMCMKVSSKNIGQRRPIRIQSAIRRAMKMFDVHLCICEPGCTATIKLRTSKYAIGHNSRGHVPWNKGLSIITNTKLQAAALASAKKRATYLKGVAPTRIELKLQSELTRLNIAFKTNAPLRGIPDIFIAPNICIFCDGCYWHKCFCHHKTKPRTTPYTPKDYYITKDLQEHGYIVLRFWEHDIMNNSNKVISIILATLAQSNNTEGDKNAIS